MKFSYRKTRLYAGRIILAIFFLFCVFLTAKISLGLLHRGRWQKIVPEEPRAETAGQQVEAAEYAAARKNLSLRAENFYLDEEQNQHLEGQVEVVDEGGAEKLIMRAPELVISPDRKKIAAGKGAEVELNHLRIKARNLNYLIDGKIAIAAEAQLLGDRLNVSVENLRYELPGRQARLEGSFKGTSGNGENNFYFTGRNGVWEERKGRLQAEELTVNLAQLQVHGQEAEVYFEKETGNFKAIKLARSCSVMARAEGKEAEWQETGLLADQVEVRNTGGQIRVLSSGKFQMEAKGHDLAMRATGEDLQLGFNNPKSLEKIRASHGCFNFTRKDGEEMVLSGEEVEYEATAGNMVLRGQAQGDFKDYELKAQELKFNLQNGSFTSSDFLMMCKPGFFSEKLPLFSQEKALYLSGEKITGSAEQVLASGRVRTWQENHLLTAGKMNLDRKGANLVLEEKVLVNCSVKSGPGGNKKITLTSERLLFLSREHRMQAEGEVAMDLAELSFKGPKMMINLDPAEEGRLLSLELHGASEVKWKDYLARGKRMIYQADKESLEISASPELETKEGHRVEAAKLTLFLADDRILVENREKERSQVIIVRGK